MVHAHADQNLCPAIISMWPSKIVISEQVFDGCATIGYEDIIGFSNWKKSMVYQVTDSLVC
jgi:hypothetical protein